MRRTAARILGVLAFWLASAAAAQDYSYFVYVDRDVNAATGCSATYPGGSIAGAEIRVTANVTGTTVSSVTTATCASGSFGSESASGGPHPVGLNNGIGGADVIEFSVSRGLFGSASVVRLDLASENGTAASSDLLSLTGSGGPIFLALNRVAIPALGGIGLLLLVGALVFVASRRMRIGMASVGALLVAGAVWAAGFATDGAVGDWAGVSPLATDPTGDASGPDIGADVVALFGAEENGRVFFRVDAVDVENQAPIAQPQAQTYLEDAAAQSIVLTASDGDGDPLTFAIQTPPTRGTLGPITPIDATSASVTYTPNANEFGADSFSFVANDGIVNSVPATVSITLTPVNDVPSFTAGPTVTIVKDTGAQTIDPWATAISAGPANESAQTLSFTITANDNPGMFSVPPAVSPTGVLTFTTAANANGTANLTLQLQDNGGTANGGVDTSATQNFVITLTPVNDAPSFTKGADQSVAEDAGPQTVDPWATAISAGPADESGQTLTFNVTGNTNPALFSTAPAVSPTGALTYTPAPDANGSATITLVLQDNGGTVDGGVDTSAPQTFAITVTAVNDAPINTVPAGPLSTGVSVPLAFTGPNSIVVADIDAAAGSVTTTVSTTLGTFTATAQNGAVVTGSGSGSVSITDVVADVNATLQTLSFASAAGGSGTITVSTNDNGNTGSGGAQTDTDSFAINIDAAPTVTTNPANGASSIAVNSNITVTFDEPVTLAGAWFTLSCGSSGVRTSTGELTGTGITIIETTPDLIYIIDPAADFANGEACTVTIDSANVVDNDAIDPPNELDGNASGDGADGDADDHVLSFSIVDLAPTATPVTASGSTIADNATITINFSENVNIAAGAITWACAPGFTPALPQNNVNSITLTPTGTLPSGSCDVTLESTLITDVDAVDPPNELDGNASGDVADGDADDQVIAYTVDTAPSVTAVSPLDNATSVAVSSNVDVTFSEAVTVNGSWFQIVCPISGARTTANTVVSGGPTVYTINPNVDFSPGENCVLTVFAAQIDDNDAFDPPSALVADFVSDFTTADVAPTATPVIASGSTIANNATITINFSENVNIAAGAIAWACAPGFTPALPQNNVNSITLTPTGTLPSGSCDVTLESTLITDVDAVDPPNELDGNASGDVTDGDADDQVIAYAVDAAPAFTTSTPANNDMNVAANANIVVNFSEPVNVSVASFTIACGGPNLAYAISGSGTAAITLNPTLDLPGGTVCTVTGVPASIDDSDAIDPPANPAPFNFSFTTQFIANDDAYPVTQHLTLNAPAAAETDANDQLGGSGVITGFGNAIGTANGTSPGTRLDDGANGSLLLNADGTFTFFPPAVPAAATTDFFYTVTGGDTASITFTYQGEMVWFVDNTPTSPVCTGSNVGTQACPAATTGAVTGSDTANDTIFVASGNYAGQTALEAGERLIGDGSTSTLQAITAITPVAGSSFAPYATFSGTPPVLSSASLTDCVVLGTGNTIRGVTIANCGGAAGDSSDINGNGFGTLTIAETTLSGTGRALNLTNGTLAGSLNSLTVTAANGDGMTLNTVGGTFNFGATNIAGVAAPSMGVNINTSSAALTFGGLTVSKTANGPGVNINASTGAITTGALAISTSNGTGLTFDNSSGALNIASGSVAATGGPAINSSSSSNWNATLATVTSTNSASQGINLNGIGGTLTMNGGSITGATGTAFFGQGTLGTTAYAGSITKGNAGKIVELTGAGATTSVTLSGNLTCNSGCTGLDVLNRTAGTYNFSGASKVLNTGASAAVTLTNNAGATINFTGGGLDIDTTIGMGFDASGPGPAATSGGTITVQGAANTITSTTGTALDVDDTTIGASGLTFQSIAASGAPSGILLNNTGAGNLTVTGTGGAGTGGTIQATAGDAVSLTAVGGVTSLSNMIVQNNLGNGIFGNGLGGLNLTAVSVLNNADNEAIDEAGINLTNLRGTSTWTSIVVADSLEDNARIINNGANVLTQLTITGSVFRDTSAVPPGNNGLLLQADGSASITADISSTQFLRNRANGLQVINNGTGTMDVELGTTGVVGSGGTHSDNNIATSIAHNGPSPGALNFDVRQMTVSHAVAAPTYASPVNINLGGATTAGSLMSGFVQNATLDNNNSGAGPGMRIISNGAGTMTARPEDNVITEHGNRGIEVIARDGSSRINATIHGNNINLTDALAADAVHVSAGAVNTDTTTICLDLNGDNNVADRNTLFSAPLNGARVRQRFASTTFLLEDYAGLATDTTAVQNFLSARNLGGDTFVADFLGSGFQPAPGADCANPL